MNYLLTISIGIYNGEKFLPETLESIEPILNTKRIEIICIDDGSQDNTGIICDEFQKKHSEFVKVVHKENKGHGSTFNSGLSISEGKYIMFMDADDLIISDEIEKYLSIIGKSNSDIILNDCRFFNDNNRNKYVIHSHKTQSIGKQENFLDEYGNITYLIHFLAFSVDFLRKNNIYADSHYKLPGEVVFLLRVTTYANTLTNTGALIYNYRLSENQFTSVDGIKKNANGYIESAISGIITYEESNKLNKFSLKRKEVVVDMVTALCSNAYIAAAYSSNPRQNINILNEKLKKERDLWNNCSLGVKFVRLNLPFQSFFLQIFNYIKLRIFKTIKD